MKNFGQLGANYISHKIFLNEGKIGRAIKKGLSSTSFNADIVPLVYLHLMKQKHPGLDDETIRNKATQAYRSASRNNRS